MLEGDSMQVKSTHLQQKSNDMAHPFKLSFGEETANAISHGVMWILLLGAIPYYAVRSYLIGGSRYAWGSSVFLICIFLMFLGSSLYHISPYDTTYKFVFRKLDHIMILLAIAGTYTPVCVVLLNNTLGYVVLGVEWIMVIAGVLLKSISSKAHPKLSMTIYMIMGWLAILILPTLLQKASPAFFGMILLGGIMYSIGAVFYSHPEKRYFHFVWHLFIVFASICHMIAILYLMV